MHALVAYVKGHTSFGCLCMVGLLEVLKWAVVGAAQVCPDDVAAELPGDHSVHCSAQQLHAVLHLPHAHHLHHLCLRHSWPGPEVQRHQCRHTHQVMPSPLPHSVLTSTKQAPYIRAMLVLCNSALCYAAAQGDWGSTDKVVYDALCRQEWAPTWECWGLTGICMCSAGLGCPCCSSMGAGTSRRSSTPSGDPSCSWSATATPASPPMTSCTVRANLQPPACCLMSCTAAAQMLSRPIHSGIPPLKLSARLAPR